MSKEIRKVRKSISRRKKIHSSSVANKQLHTETITPSFPLEEEKHGYFPNYLENSSVERKGQEKASMTQPLIKGIMSIVLFLGISFIWNTEAGIFLKAKTWTNEALTEEFPFAKVNHWYKETFGNPLSLTDDSPQPVQSTNTLVLPVDGNIEETFADNGEGIFIAPDDKVDVSSLQEGIVIFSGKDDQTDQTVVIQHPDGSKTTYGHLEKADAHLYQFVEKNQIIGQFIPTEMNQMVYFSIEKNDEYVDPLQVIKVDDN